MQCALLCAALTVSKTCACVAAKLHAPVTVMYVGNARMPCVMAKRARCHRRQLQQCRQRCRSKCHLISYSPPGHCKCGQPQFWCSCSQCRQACTSSQIESAPPHSYLLGLMQTPEGQTTHQGTGGLQPRPGVPRSHGTPLPDPSTQSTLQHRQSEYAEVSEPRI